MSKSLKLKSHGQVKAFDVETFKDAVQFLGIADVKRILKPQIYLKPSKKILRENIKRNFERGRAGFWKPLKRSTHVIRAIRGYPSSQFPMLKRTGALERSFRDLTYELTGNKMMITLQSTLSYAAIQNAGGTVTAERIHLRNIGAKESKRGHLTILVEPGETPRNMPRKFKKYENPKREMVSVKVPARPFAYIDAEGVRELERLVFDEVIARIMREKQ